MLIPTLHFSSWLACGMRQLATWFKPKLTWPPAAQAKTRTQYSDYVACWLPLSIAANSLSARYWYTSSHHHNESRLFIRDTISGLVWSIHFDDPCDIATYINDFKRGAAAACPDRLHAVPTR